MTDLKEWGQGIKVKQAFVEAYSYLLEKDPTFLQNYIGDMQEELDSRLEGIKARNQENEKQ